MTTDTSTATSKRRLWPWLALGVAIAIVAAVIGGELLAGPSAPATRTVVYTVEADAAFGGGRTGMVTAGTPGGGTSQRTGPLPITGSFTFHPGDHVYVSVQNQQGAGSVTCRITVDGLKVSENTSSGGYAIATCQGQVP